MLPELVDWFPALAQTSFARFRSQYADPPTAFCRPHFHPQVRHQHQIPIAPAATPVPNLPRLRALALFGRRPPQRVDRPASRQPKTSTNAEVSLFIYQHLAAGIFSLAPTRRLSAFRSKLAKEAAVISPHPLLKETTFIVKPEDV
jgi:hypothetical protein